jgi:hypothetical protein
MHYENGRALPRELNELKSVMQNSPIISRVRVARPSLLREISLDTEIYVNADRFSESNLPTRLLISWFIQNYAKYSHLLQIFANIAHFSFFFFHLSRIELIDQKTSRFPPGILPRSIFSFSVANSLTVPLKREINLSFFFFFLGSRDRATKFSFALHPPAENPPT